jgi:hypothetical protein
MYAVVSSYVVLSWNALASSFVGSMWVAIVGIHHGGLMKSTIVSEGVMAICGKCFTRFSRFDRNIVVLFLLFLAFSFHSWSGCSFGSVCILVSVFSTFSYSLSCGGIIPVSICIAAVSVVRTKPSIAFIANLCTVLSLFCWAVAWDVLWFGRCHIIATYSVLGATTAVYSQRMWQNCVPHVLFVAPDIASANFVPFLIIYWRCALNHMSLSKITPR